MPHQTQVISFQVMYASFLSLQLDKIRLIRSSSSAKCLQSFLNFPGRSEIGFMTSSTQTRRSTSIFHTILFSLLNVGHQKTLHVPAWDESVNKSTRNLRDTFMHDQGSIFRASAAKVYQKYYQTKLHTLTKSTISLKSVTVSVRERSNTICSRWIRLRICRSSTDSAPLSESS